MSRNTTSGGARWAGPTTWAPAWGSGCGGWKCSRAHSRISTPPEPRPSPRSCSSLAARGRRRRRPRCAGAHRQERGHQGWQFAAHAESPKVRQLADRPHAALTFHWPLHGCQIRVRGTVEPAAPE
ncbi:pyridoxamine 5'-phosphate oxidase family protein [Amycolatopsis sp.]|uniref:pyridoxamine 5'-phosphate oxidase family protein n=1 Tax=Amycolatopsis sp. TaxID=37632 RepID=UPI002BA932B6|nr:pyridoxamine 5'-phosphate oxidase family protein [Amycolatopsis sp.]HVV07699.1 pyridoxamine 5'-phosphate oxidase family protein [Amycolatopsis sp.]